MRYLNIDETLLTQRGGLWTAKEIEQQPGSWLHTQKALKEREQEIAEFLRPLVARESLRIVLTGAGSSAYIGQCIAPALVRTLNRRVEAIATTEIVSRPAEYLQPNVPTLLVSFARSGNSPESVAAVDLVRQQVEDSAHLVLTCNAEGKLLTTCGGRKDSLVLLLPEETHDRSFAMTSSFSSMLYAAQSVLLGQQDGERVAAAGKAVIQNFNEPLQALAGRAHDRVVFLGSAGLMGIANEAALKLLELTDGRVTAMAHSPLGFRHGPKTFINPDTLVVVFLSNDPLTRRYDLDLLREVRNDGVAGSVLAITAHADAGEHLLIPGMSYAEDTELALPFVVCAQLYAFHRSLLLGNSPDSPSVSGTVSRVVQGVKIHVPGS